MKNLSNQPNHLLLLEKAALAKTNRILRHIIMGFSFSYGRSKITGHITSFHRGGGVKNIFRKIEFSNTGYNSIILGTLYDPCRSSFISLNFDLEKLSFFRLPATSTAFTGSFICCNSFTKELKVGYRTQLKNIPAGSIINNLSLKHSKISQYIRSAGCYGQIIQMSLLFAKIKLPSNSILNISVNSFASVGVISNLEYNSICYGKAGNKRRLGRRPIVRGIAMNPVDHPHGGRTNGGRISVTP
jgi:large subunit ribosomal protein L2